MITVNGKTCVWEKGLTVRGLLDLKRYTYPKIIVKINDSHVETEEYETVNICDNDVVQVIHLMAGG